MLRQRNGSGNSREQRRRACRQSNVPAVVDPYGPFGFVAGAMSADSLSPTIAEPDPLTPFYVGFTSGSTGAPKGYPRHYQSWIESFRAGDRGIDIGIDDVVLAPVALMQSLFLTRGGSAMLWSDTSNRDESGLHGFRWKISAVI